MQSKPFRLRDKRTNQLLYANLKGCNRHHKRASVFSSRRRLLSLSQEGMCKRLVNPQSPENLYVCDLFGLRKRHAVRTSCSQLKIRRERMPIS